MRSLRRDLQSGTHLTSYKGNGCPRNGLCTLGRDYLVAVQAAKQALHFWTWHKVRPGTRHALRGHGYQRQEESKSQGEKGLVSRGGGGRLHNP